MSADSFLTMVRHRNPGETEFHQAVYEVYESIERVLLKNPKYQDHKIMERIVEPERVITFRVTWEDDAGEVQVNRGYRVQMNSALGPYKGGLRFHPSVNGSILKFLGFEQVFKNALTGLPLGGGKGGSDFDPKPRSDNEIMRFCHSFMIELSRHIGHRIDVPAGDIGVGAREIGYLYGIYKKLSNQTTGVLTGKGIEYGGSYIRPEATGYGLIYFAENMLAVDKKSIKGKRCIVSGAGNVALHAIEKIIELGGIPITASDSSGHIFDEEGINKEKLEHLKFIKEVRRERISEYVEKYKDAVYVKADREAKENPIWNHQADCAFPCATQNELGLNDAQNLNKNGVKLVAEGANMPTTPDAINYFLDNGIKYAPGKASNAGGVATSGLEMIQNFVGERWPAKLVDEKLQGIMKDIHNSCRHYAAEYDEEGNYQLGANIAGFTKVADSMISQGVI